MERSPWGGEGFTPIGLISFRVCVCVCSQGKVFLPPRLHTHSSSIHFARQCDNNETLICISWDSNDFPESNRDHTISRLISFCVRRLFQSSDTTTLKQNRQRLHTADSSPKHFLMAAAARSERGGEECRKIFFLCLFFFFLLLVCKKRFGVCYLLTKRG